MEGKQIRVMVVDDNPGVRADLRMVLELDGRIEVVAEATNGEEAVHKARRIHPDVVLMDLEMPGMDGLEATWEIKNKHYAQAVVILTAHANEDARKRSLQSGADAYLIKGTPVGDLINRLVEAFEQNEPQKTHNR
jgi:DNA-binding NarL/FixJ family response regulator